MVLFPTPSYFLEQCCECWGNREFHKLDYDLVILVYSFSKAQCSMTVHALLQEDLEVRGCLFNEILLMLGF